MMLAMAATYDPDPEAPLGFRLPLDLETGELIAGALARAGSRTIRSTSSRDYAREPASRCAASTSTAAGATSTTCTTAPRILSQRLGAARHRAPLRGVRRQPLVDRLPDGREPAVPLQGRDRLGAAAPIRTRPATPHGCAPFATAASVRRRSSRSSTSTRPSRRGRGAGCASTRRASTRSTGRSATGHLRFVPVFESPAPDHRLRRRRRDRRGRRRARPAPRRRARVRLAVAVRPRRLVRGVLRDRHAPHRADPGRHRLRRRRRRSPSQRGPPCRRSPTRRTSPPGSACSSPARRAAWGTSPCNTRSTWAPTSSPSAVRTTSTSSPRSGRTAWSTTGPPTSRPCDETFDLVFDAANALDWYAVAAPAGARRPVPRDGRIGPLGRGHRHRRAAGAARRGNARPQPHAARQPAGPGTAGAPRRGRRAAAACRAAHRPRRRSRRPRRAMATGHGRGKIVVLPAGA